MSDPGPAVRFPPPLIFLSGFAGGWAFDHWLLRWALVSEARLLLVYVLAAVFALAALWLLIAALGGFRRRGNDPRPWREDSALVTDGIYRHTRNPMYLGMALLYVAGALGLNSLWPLLTLGPVLFLLHRYVIAREEAYLQRRFGVDYVGYCAQVRRWL
jgi:protein-S-isoprenylcysteine O-methyltransferase Ste14